MAAKMAKSQFSLTCTLLSQYLKENGTFGSIGLEMAPMPLHLQAKENYRAPTTLSLLPGADVSTENHADKVADLDGPKSMELFPQLAGSAEKEEPIKTPSEIGKGQLTIFYSGKVMVFDDFPAEKAKDLMQMAGKESAAAQKLGFTVPASSTGSESSAKQNTIFAPTTSTQPPAAPAPKPAQTTASDMPIARRNSLHRFLEKRKDRINTKAPYQVHGGSPAPETQKAEGSQAWLGLGRQAVKQEQSCESSR
ncbi:hypothetical protein Cni_G00762 [Canna indica]|uniref:Protein TIFY n=1 Tax=Canna indica TaxID=4628 RepID=A0AAQ3JLU9_9LILI|nr:hypothetical protein Cni_G00762 [Canna indica]